MLSENIIKGQLIELKVQEEFKQRYHNGEFKEVI